MGDVFNVTNVLTQSFTEVSGEEGGKKTSVQKSKRNAVVDDLASRMPA